MATASAKTLPRREPLTHHRALRRSELDALLTVIELLDTASDPERAFDALVEAIRPVLAFDSIAVAEGGAEAPPLVACAPGLESLRSTTTAIAASARRYFARETSLDEHAALLASQSRKWICLPLSVDGKTIVGGLTFSSSAAVGEGTLSFLACVARHFARTVREAHQASDEAVVSSRDVERVPMSRTAELANILAGDPSLGRGEALARLARGAASLLAGGCAIDFEEGLQRRRVLEVDDASEAVVAVLNRVVARVIADAEVVCAAGDGGPPVDEIDRARIDLGRGWLVAAPIIVDDRAIGAFIAFGNAMPGRACALVDRFAETAAREIVRTSEPEDVHALLRERDEMLSTVSHDLQNPLGVILMSAAFLLEGMPHNDRRRAGRAQIEAIHRNARRMKRLVTDLLDFDAIEAGCVSMAPKALHPRTLVNVAIEDSMLAANAAGVTLRRGTMLRLPLVWADADRIIQVLSNLLTNAIKFTPRGGRITVRAQRSSEAEVTFFVEDSGIGIPPEQLSHVFERHWQAPSKGRTGGFGLGLAICKSLIGLSHGRIWVESQCGKGTTFMFSRRRRSASSAEQGPARFGTPETSRDRRSRAEPPR